MSGDLVSFGQHRAAVKLTERVAARRRCRDALELAAVALADAIVEGEGAISRDVELRLVRLLDEAEEALARLG